MIRWGTDDPIGSLYRVTPLYHAREGNFAKVATLPYNPVHPVRPVHPNISCSIIHMAFNPRPNLYRE